VTDPTADRVLVSADWLREALAGDGAPTVLDVRWRIAGPPGRDDYDAGHVPGSVFIDLDTELAAAVRADRVGGRHPLPTTAEFQASMRQAGVSSGRRVVTIDDGDGPAASRAWWCLRYFGHPDVRIVEGGWAAWLAAGGLVTDAAPEVAPGDFVATPGGLPVVDATGAAAAGAASRLLDVRAPVRFRGEQELVDPVAGHIPGARNIPVGQVASPDGWAEPQALKTRLDALGVDTAAQPVASCGSGVGAAVLVAALAREGIDAALYAGSWSDWISDPARSVAVGD